MTTLSYFSIIEDYKKW